MRAYRANVTQRIFLSEITLPDAAAAFSRVTHDTPPPSSSSVDRDTQEEERNVWILSFFFHSLRVCMYSSQDVEPSFFSLSLHNWQSINLCIDDHDSTTSKHHSRFRSPSLSFVPRSWPTSSSMADNLALELDAGIRVWVLLPITVAMFLVGVLRHLASKLLTSKPAPPRGETQLAQLKEAQAVMRAQVRPSLSERLSLSFALCMCMCMCVCEKEKHREIHDKT